MKNLHHSTDRHKHFRTETRKGHRFVRFMVRQCRRRLGKSNAVVRSVFGNPRGRTNPLLVANPARTIQNLSLRNPVERSKGMQGGGSTSHAIPALIQGVSKAACEGARLDAAWLGQRASRRSCTAETGRGDRGGLSPATIGLLLSALAVVRSTLETQDGTFRA